MERRANNKDDTDVQIGNVESSNEGYMLENENSSSNNLSQNISP